MSVFEQAALQLGELLREQKAEDVVVLDLRPAHIWTDFFVIATVSSARHAGGLTDKVMEAAKDLQIEKYHTIRKSSDGDEWKLIDLGGIIIHLMSETARNFYALEKIWYDSKNILE